METAVSSVLVKRLFSFVSSLSALLLAASIPLRLDPKARESTTCGDRHTEVVASNLKFLTPKDCPGLFSKMSEASTAYAVANDHDGAKVSTKNRLFKPSDNCLGRWFERNWMLSTSRHYLTRISGNGLDLSDTTRFLVPATPTLYVNSPCVANRKQTIHRFACRGVRVRGFDCPMATETRWSAS